MRCEKHSPLEKLLSKEAASVASQRDTVEKTFPGRFVEFERDRSSSL
jgi:hypothetical protein